jgi:hypothetical protein
MATEAVAYNAWHGRRFLASFFVGLFSFGIFGKKEVTEHGRFLILVYYR